MPNTPLPKPAPPKPALGQANQIPAGQTVSVAPPKAEAKPPQPTTPAPQITQPNPVVVKPIAQGSAATNSATPASSPAAPSSNATSASSKETNTVSPTSTSNVAVPPQKPPAILGGTPPPPTNAAPNDIFPSEPASSSGVNQSVVGAPVPSSLPTAGAPEQPPKTLNALQSMSSNKLPGLPPEQARAQQAFGQSPQQNQSSGQNKLDSKDSGNDPGDEPEIAKPKKSILRFLPIVLGVILILAAVGFAAYWFLWGGGSSGSSTKPPNGAQTTPESTGVEAPPPQEVADSVVLEYWGLWEPNEAMDSVISDYEENNPGIKINYKKQSYQDYRERLQNAIVSDNGPDIFRYHAAWVPMLEAELAPLPSAVMTSSEFSSTFYPVAAKQLNVDGQIVGIPLMYEGLALYYNTEVFATTVVDPPTTWSELREVAKKLAVTGEDGTTRAGVAMGNATNVEHFSDILAVLMLQNEADMMQPNSPETRDALLFYTNFIKKDKVWNETLPSSTIAFAQGDVAMMIAPSWRAHEVRAQNPNLPFAVVPIPQLSDSRVAWASYWAEGVSERSENKTEAWQFIKYLSSASVQKQLHADQSQLRAFGELYSRVDLANELADDPIMSAYLQDAPYAEGWYMSSYTHDDGLNDNIIKYYEDAVTSLLQGTGIDEVLETLDQGVRQELRQYGVDGE